MRKKQYLLALVLMLTSARSTAQPGLNEMQQVQSNLNASFFSALNFALVIAAIFGIIGALRIYHNWQMGKPRITDEVTAWFLAAIFMVMTGSFLRAIFGL